MTDRQPGAGFRSPLETLAIIGLGVAMSASVLLWACGVVLGSLMGATLAGSGIDGLAEVIRNLPEVGHAWEPPLPSWAIWSFAAVLVLTFGPLVWRLVRASRLADNGVEWASVAQLQHAGLLLVERPLTHSELEAPTDE